MANRISLFHNFVFLGEENSALIITTFKALEVTVGAIILLQLFK